MTAVLVGSEVVTVSFFALSTGISSALLPSTSLNVLFLFRRDLTTLSSSDSNVEVSSARASFARASAYVSGHEKLDLQA